MRAASGQATNRDETHNVFVLGRRFKDKNQRVVGQDETWRDIGTEYKREWSEQNTAGESGGKEINELSVPSKCRKRRKKTAGKNRRSVWGASSILGSCAREETLVVTSVL